MRFRPRFSVRTLTIFVTVVCAYFGAWEATKKYGVEKISGVTKTNRSAIIKVPAGSVASETFTVASESPAPFIVSRSVYRFEYLADVPEERQYSVANGPVRYYLWLFGPRIKLPFESEW